MVSVALLTTVSVISTMLTAAAPAHAAPLTTPIPAKPASCTNQAFPYANAEPGPAAKIWNHMENGQLSFYWVHPCERKDMGQQMGQLVAAFDIGASGKGSWSGSLTVETSAEFELGATSGVISGAMNFSVSRSYTHTPGCESDGPGHWEVYVLYRTFRIPIHKYAGGGIPRKSTLSRFDPVVEDSLVKYFYGVSCIKMYPS